MSKFPIDIELTVDGLLDETWDGDRYNGLRGRIEDAILAERRRCTDALRGNWHGVYLDGRNEHGSHVIRLPHRSIELDQDENGDFLKYTAETILQDAERLGFAIGDAVIVAFESCRDEGWPSYYEYAGISPELTALFYGMPEEQTAEKAE